jgi:lipoprotein signal peptidase
MAATIIAGLFFIAVGLLQLFKPTRIYTDKPEVQTYFRPEKYSLFNIAVSLVMIGFGVMLIYASVK